MMDVRLINSLINISPVLCDYSNSKSSDRMSLDYYDYPKFHYTSGIFLRNFISILDILDL